MCESAQKHLEDLAEKHQETLQEVSSLQEKLHASFINDCVHTVCQVLKKISVFFFLQEAETAQKEDSTEKESLLSQLQDKMETESVLQAKVQPTLPPLC